MFNIINGNDAYFQVQWYHLEDFFYDSMVKEYFCISSDYSSGKYLYPLDNLYQNPKLPLDFYPYFFTLAEQQEWGKIKDIIIILQKQGYSPLPFGERYFNNKEWSITNVSIKKNGLLLEYTID